MSQSRFRVFKARKTKGFKSNGVMAVRTSAFFHHSSFPGTHHTLNVKQTSNSPDIISTDIFILTSESHKPSGSSSGLQNLARQWPIVYFVLSYFCFFLFSLSNFTNRELKWEVWFVCSLSNKLGWGRGNELEKMISCLVGESLSFFSCFENWFV